MSATAAPTQHLVIDNTMGAAVIGSVCAAALWGVTCVQTWYYFSRYGNDTMYIKALVLLCWVCDTVHQALITHTVYFYVICNYDNPSALADMTWCVLRILSGFIGLMVQGFLTMRVWRCNNFCFSISQCARLTAVLRSVACSVAFTIESLQLTTWVQLNHLKGLSMTVNVLAAIGDVVIAGSLCFYLHRSRTGFKRSDTMISKLILFAVSTGLLTSVCAIASLISIAVWGGTLIYVAFYFRYSNSLLATLNARNGIRGLIDDPESLSFSLQSRSKSVHRTVNTSNGTGISIQISTVQDVNREETTAHDSVSVRCLDASLYATDSESC
ncbi:hypothetical protein FISHEDRAFT_48246 [Fistulina hepatica ATCC 64428]|uniref:DUF6534 domain-containing protein n=1 Tax=Fistulina hepatica ATCC 64428 TaxID=1128425 RepID=A0A0D7A5H1_9AGAR|nr:hypothetical protein FISHEDRAFT_48246 [Fistulina hepatica ATCC 64428]